MQDLDQGLYFRTHSLGRYTRVAQVIGTDFQNNKIGFYTPNNVAVESTEFFDSAATDTLEKYLYRIFGQIDDPLNPLITALRNISFKTTIKGVTQNEDFRLRWHNNL